MVVAQQEGAVWAHRSCVLKRRDQRRVLAQVRSAEMWAPSVLMQVNVKYAQRPRERRTHRIANRIAANPGTDSAIPHVLTVGYSDIPEGQDQQRPALLIPESAVHEPDALGGERMRPTQIGSDVVEKRPCYPECPAHRSALIKGGIIWARLGRSPSIRQENACQFRSMILTLEAFQLSTVRVRGTCEKYSRNA